MMRTAVDARKDYSLEALRGLASIAVLFWHSMLGFFPERAGVFPGLDPSKALNTQAWFGLIYGPAAVVFFFVLSGFVLTRSFFISGDTGQIFRNGLKRWPRLAFPVMIAVVGSWFAFKFDLYSFREAAQLTGSPWLAQFAWAGELPAPMNFSDAVRQGAYRTFFRGDSYYDSNLWTMRFEFIGSFISFGLALIMAPTERASFRVYLGLIIVVLCYYVSPWYVAFPVGVMLAGHLTENRNVISGPVGIGMIAIAVYCLGFTGSTHGAFLPLGLIWPSWVSSIYLNIVGAGILISTVIMCSSIHRFLSTRWGAALGKLSFPLYLVHIPVLCSLGSAIFLILAPRVTYPLAQMAASISTMVGSIALAYPLAIINEWWIKMLNAAVNSLTKDKKVEGGRHVSLAHGSGLRSDVATRN